METKKEKFTTEVIENKEYTAYITTCLESGKVVDRWVVPNEVKI